jgi:cell division protein FtsQ
LRVTLGIALVVGTSLGVAASAHRYALTSPRFSVQKLVTRGNSRLDLAQIRSEGGIAVGANLFALDPRAVELRLLKNPWVSEARVTRQLPSTLEVQITEREARVVALLGDRLYLVSREGEPFKEVEPKDPVDLPVVTGLLPDGLVRDRARELERLEVALDVLVQYERLPLSRVHVPQEIHLSEGGSITLIVGRAGIVVELGKERFRQRLLMAERVIGELRQAGRVPGIVFADNEAHPERVVVRMR